MNDQASLYNRLLNELTEFLSFQGIKYAVLCPGSRSAPLALAFMRNNKIKHFIVNDERSAGYMALGLALNNKFPVVLVCTSGTAALNFSPSVAEAFNQHISLMVLTADRPEEMIGIGENQTIIQKNLFEPNVHASFRMNLLDYYLNESGFIEHFTPVFKECLKGPVHLNLPFSEPFYPKEKNDGTKTKSFQKIIPEIPSFKLDESFIDIFNHSENIIILPGLQVKNEHLLENLNNFSEKFNIPVLNDITSNTQSLKQSIFQIDHCLSVNKKNVDLKPDLLITFGTHTVSRKLIKFLTENKAKNHWHISSFGEKINTFQSLTETFFIPPAEFFKLLYNNEKLHNKSLRYFNSWKRAEENAQPIFHEKLLTDIELQVMKYILDYLPENSILHLGNSLSVRLANEIGLSHKPNTEVYSNRGTSGIDGCLSTAIGFALASEKPNFIVLGDQSFLYDQNALWNKVLPQNLKIIVINNKGGGIFKRLEGSSVQAELNEYFVNYIPVNIEKIANSHSIDYFSLNYHTFKTQNLINIYNFSKLAIIEVTF